jgi:hypothetical protein
MAVLQSVCVCAAPHPSNLIFTPPQFEAGSEMVLELLNTNSIFR